MVHPVLATYSYTKCGVWEMACLDKPDISVSELLCKHLPVLGRDGSLRLRSTIKINKSLQSRGQWTSVKRLGNSPSME